MRAAIACACLALAACGGMGQPREPEVRIVHDDRIIQRPCPDARPPADDYPDTDEKLAAIAPDDFERLFRVARAGRDLREARLSVDDVQIKGCAGQ